MATGGRKTHLPHIHQISQAFGPASAASGLLGVLPNGAVLLTAHISVSQAFNSTTNTLALGTTPGGSNLMAATDLKTVARTDTPVPIAVQGPWVGDTPVYWTIASTGGASSQGGAVAFLDYIANIG